MSNRKTNIRPANPVKDTSGPARGKTIMFTTGLCAADARTDGLVSELGVDPRIVDDTPLPRTRRSWYLPIKFGTEWLVAFGLLLLSAPLMCVLATLVKATSTGPALYM